MERDFQIIPYSDLHNSRELVENLFHEFGFVALSGVPQFIQTYTAFIESSKAFMQLDESERSRYSPKDKYCRGWSFGVEGFEGKLDTHKGSYYATIPEERAPAPNIWPDMTPFKESFLQLASIIYTCGEEILSLVGLPSNELTGLGRMLYYGPIANQDSYDNWCGSHRDHGLLTGLCPGVTFKDGECVPCPPGAGLYVQGKEIRLPQDSLIIQVGEAAELVSNGRFKATEHSVRKAYGGYERYSFAVFFDPPPDYIIDSNISTYDDRYKQGMKYAEWSKATYMKYNQSQEAV